MVGLIIQGGSVPRSSEALLTWLWSGLLACLMSTKDWFLEDSSSICSIPLCSTGQYLKQYDAGGTQEQDGKLRWEERKESGEVGGERKCAQSVYRLKPRAWETVQWVEHLPYKCKELGWIPRTYYLKQDTEASSWNPCAPTEGGEIETAGPSAAHRLAILVHGQGEKIDLSQIKCKVRTYLTLLRTYPWPPPPPHTHTQRHGKIKAFLISPLL